MTDRAGLFLSRGGRCLPSKSRNTARFSFTVVFSPFNIFLLDRTSLAISFLPRGEIAAPFRIITSACGVQWSSDLLSCHLSVLLVDPAHFWCSPSLHCDLGKPPPPFLGHGCSLLRTAWRSWNSCVTGHPERLFRELSRVCPEVLLSNECSAA